MPAPMAPTTAYTFELVSLHDPALDHAACCDGWDAYPNPRAVPDGIAPEQWAAFCETGQRPAEIPSDLWRDYRETGDRSHLVTTGPLHVYTCRALSAQELEWAQVQAGGDVTALHAAIVGVSLQSVDGPRPVSAADVSRQRERTGFVRHIGWDSPLWRDDEVFPALTLHSLAGQISQRSRMPEAAATFRQAGRKV